MKWACLALLAASACVADVSPEPGADLGADDDGAGADLHPAVDDGYVPHAVTATRFGVLYQISADVLATYQGAAHGLPASADHAWIVSQSQGATHATRTLADLVHKRADFYYAPAFDLWNAYPDWESASTAQLQSWAHAFRDTAIAAHADLFSFNEVPTSAPTNASVRTRIATILRALHDPDGKGRRLWGVTYLTEAAGTPGNYGSERASDFFAALDETNVAVVVEHYHSNGFVCGQGEPALAAHFFALHAWLLASGEPAKVSIANGKFTVLHSARYADGASAWAGGNSANISLADFQRDLSRATRVTRETEGGYNRLAFGPLAASITSPGVAPRIAELFRWHYGAVKASATETPCVAGAAVNCTCN